MTKANARRVATPATPAPDAAPAAPAPDAAQKDALLDYLFGNGG
jgi:hypothetical protein